jgi:hypothetical protein
LTLPNHYQGIFHNQSGYINATTLMIALFRIIDQNPNITIREQENVLSFELFDNESQLVTDRGVLYASRKIIFLPGTSLNNLSYLLNLDFNLILWELPIYYFRRLPMATQLPTWLGLGNHDPYSLFAGFSIDPTSDYIIIKPNFIRNLSNPLIYPSQKTNIIDPFITQKVIEWISRHMSVLINVSDYYSYNQTYLSPFLPGNGYLLDYVPRTNKRMLIQASSIGLTFAPIWADILSDMSLFEINSSSKYAKYMNYFSLPQPNSVTIFNQGYRLTIPWVVLYCLLMFILIN